MQKNFCKSLVKRPFHSPITVSAKQAARTQATKQAFTTLRAGRKAARQSVEQIRLPVRISMYACTLAVTNPDTVKR